MTEISLVKLRKNVFLNTNIENNPYMHQCRIADKVMQVNMYCIAVDFIKGDFIIER